MNMKKFTGYRLQVTAISLLALFLTATYHLQPATSLAQESTESGLLQKLNDLKTEIASKAAQIKTEITQKVQNKAIVGTILDITDSEITIQTLNATKTIKHDEFTSVIGAKNKEIKIDTLETDDKIAALGDVDDKNTLIAKRLVFLDNYASNSAQLVWGQIEKTAGNLITIKNKSGNPENISTTTQTQFFLGHEEASILDAKVEKHLVARGTRQKDGSLKAKFIYFIPSMGFTKPTEKSTPIPNAASPSASPKR